MPATLPQALEAVLAGVDRRALRTATRALVEVYRSGAPPGRLVLEDAASAAAYAAYRMPATHAAVTRALHHATSLDRELQVRSMVDLGGGTGAASWAAAEAFDTLERVEVVDASAAALQLGRRLARHGPPAVSTATWTRSVVHEAFVAPTADLAVIGYVLGELPEALHRPLVRTVTTSSRLALVLEPGTPRGYAAVLAARSLLVASGWHVLAPCPQDGPCPVAGRRGDWCHFAVRLDRSALHRHLKDAALGHEDEKFSYVFASREPVVPAASRVLRRPVRRKGLVQLELCRQNATAGSEVLTRRDPSAYRTARDVVWGDALPLPPP